jgi:peptidoglycan/xylan/chitin deacetylase (PgdA/CDA1 family)
METAAIVEIAAGFEIGAHGYSHVPSKGLPEEQAYEMIRKGKDWLE